MARDCMTDEQVELEIIRLTDNEDVHLAQKELRIKNKRRAYAAQLKWLEKRGKELRAQGITAENMEEKLFGSVTEEI